jgi:membrane protein
MLKYRQILTSFLAHDGPFLAGGLSFFFLICFIPLVFLLVSAVGYVLSAETVTGQIREALAQALPVYHEEVTQTLLRIIETRRSSGVLGTTILVIFSSQLFAALRHVLSRVLGHQGQVLWHGMVFDTVMVFAIGFLFLANVGTTAIVEWLRVMAERQVHIPSHWMGRLSILLGFAFATAMFFLTYFFFPYRRVALRAALGGALVASVLWELAKHLLRIYVVRLGLYDEIYGPLGILMAFTMFVYYSAIVFLVGAEVVRELDPGDGAAAPG